MEAEQKVITEYQETGKEKSNNEAAHSLGESKELESKEDFHVIC